MSEVFQKEDHLEELESFQRELDRLRGGRGMLMNALHIAQNMFGHIPPVAQQMIADTLDIPLATVYGVITFYARYTLIPKGKCEVSVCLGTACYIQGSKDLLGEAAEKLGIQGGETTEDGLFSLSTTRCVGACGLAPVVTVNEDVHGRLDRKGMAKLLEELKTSYEESSDEDDA